MENNIEINVNRTNRSKTVSIQVLRGQVKISVPKNMTLLDAALNQKIDVPYSCQGGVCSSCIGKITEGSAKMLQNNILSAEEIEEGLILACQAIPTTSSISIDFDDV